jgi:hypothetical protein
LLCRDSRPRLSSGPGVSGRSDLRSVILDRPVFSHCHPERGLVFAPTGRIAFTRSKTGKGTTSSRADQAPTPNAASAAETYSRCPAKSGASRMPGGTEGSALRRQGDHVGTAALGCPAAKVYRAAATLSSLARIGLRADREDWHSPPTKPGRARLPVVPIKRPHRTRLQPLGATHPA